jgi:membrane associated rhomboid family serine protease
VAATPKRAENLHSVYVLLFLNIAFFFLEHQDAGKYARMFSFDWSAVTSGEVWRLVTWQFTQAGQGWFAFPKPVVLFFTLLLLYIMGSAVEDVWGSVHFLALFVASTLTSALTAAFFGVPLLGSYFVNFSLLFVYAATFPQQTFYLFGMMPVRIRWIAWVAAFVLISGVVAGGAANAAAAAGAAVSLAYYMLMRRPVTEAVKFAEPPPAAAGDTTAVRNAARFVGIRKVLASGKSAEIDRLSDQFKREVVRGVNICPPVDYKPENSDGYCIRCDGFAECSARYLAMQRRDTPAEVSS